jgi:hypothetical protein
MSCVNSELEAVLLLLSYYNYQYYGGRLVVPVLEAVLLLLISELLQLQQ